MRLTAIERILVASAMGLMAITFVGDNPAARPQSDSQVLLVIEEPDAAVAAGHDCPFGPVLA